MITVYEVIDPGVDGRDCTTVGRFMDRADAVRAAEGRGGMGGGNGHIREIRVYAPGEWVSGADLEAARQSGRRKLERAGLTARERTALGIDSPAP